MRKEGIKILMVILLLSNFIAHPVHSEGGSYESATEYDYPPFSVTSSGEADGFSVDLLKAVAKEMDLSITFKIDEWKTIKDELARGELDVLPLVGYTEERDVYFDFTVPYIVMHGNIFVREGEDLIQSEADLKGKELLVMDGDNAMEYIMSHGYGENLVVVKTYTEAFEILSLGKYDAVIAQSIVGLKLINELGIDNVVPVERIAEDGKTKTKLNLEGFEQKFCFAVHEGDKELLGKLNEGLLIIVENGSYDEIYKKWFPFDISNQFPLKTVIISIVIGTSFLAIIILIVSVYSIRKEVKKKTRSIELVNEELLKMKNNADEANRAKSQFLANMSHEIRTPLNSIFGMIQLLEITETTKEQKEYIDIATNSRTLLLSVINDILDISKIESGKMTIESIDFNLFDLVEETTKVFMIQAATKGISFNTYISPLLPKTISSDMVRIKQVMINLISNAMKFTEIGQVEIHVKPVEGIVGLWIEFIVSDTGIGLSPRKVETLFEAFNQLDSSISRRFGGSGLGLSICKGIIDGMGGDIWAESEEGKGSQFHFKVPYVEAELGTE